ncbi:MAG: hypothetical protein QOG63_1758 [Thermoleophilaceae bacterium]|nr:hypothetical protein [Thermoleophilaceae bacterium]
MQRRLAPIFAAVALLALPAFAHGFGNVFPAVSGNPADRLLSQPIDPYGYDYATHCVKHPTKGALALQGWLGRHAGGVAWGIVRCEMWGKNKASLHAEGRALDWHLSARVPSEKREAQRLIALLLAPDRAGNQHALARRMGVQEIIFNCQGWFSGDGGMRPYSVCFDSKGRPKQVDDTTAHRDHVHFGLNHRGARMKTSFWQSPLAKR